MCRLLAHISTLVLHLLVSWTTRQMVMLVFVERTMFADLKYFIKFVLSANYFKELVIENNWC
jgi:hypothetical protein